MDYRSEALEPGGHDLSKIDSGDPGLTHGDASSLDAPRPAGWPALSWWLPTSADLVVGYCSLTGHRRVRDALPASIGRGRPAEILAVLLARPAVERSHQGRRMEE